jgi:hypothetical protein
MPLIINGTMRDQPSVTMARCKIGSPLEKMGRTEAGALMGASE